jgi:ATP-dependent RNA helicase DDX24/MAK5
MQVLVSLKLNLTKISSVESDIGEMNIDHDILNKLKARVQLARDIDRTQHQITKRNYESNWMKETAKALEIMLDSDEEYVL